MIDWWMLAAEAGYKSPGEWLAALYKERTIVEVAKYVGCSVSAVKDAMARYRIATRPHGGQRFKGRRAC